MGFSCGIVGLPNVGKSTLFNALASTEAAASNYPFCTIEPNVGVVLVPDPRLDKLEELVPTEKVVPTAIKFVDIAGLVKGASQGEGLGNQFLGQINEVDAIAHVVRCFEDPNVIHVSGSVDPKRDIEIINTELALKDLNVVQGNIKRCEKQAKSGDKESIKLLPILNELIAILDQGIPVRAKLGSLPKDTPSLIKPLNLLTAKPVMYVANISESQLHDYQQPAIKAVEGIAEAEGSPVIPICGAIESQIASLESQEERTEYLEAVGLKEPGLNRLIRAGYELLGLLTFFTVGPKEDRAWTVRRGAKAPEAAGCIHSDMERGFIRAEIISYDDFIDCGSEAVVKDKGKLRIEGKEYVMKDGDLVLFRFSV